MIPVYFVPQNVRVLFGEEKKMNQKQNISLTGKIITVFASILSIITVSGKWLNLRRIPMIFGTSVPHKYSLYDISEFLDKFDMYLHTDSFRFFATFFSVSATVVIILSVLNVILVLIDKKIVKVSAVLTAVVSIAAAAVFLIAVRRINMDMREATYGGINKLLGTTAKPYWLILFSVASNVGCCLKQKKTNVLSESNDNEPKRVCVQCGAETERGSAFCTSCGAQVVEQTSEWFCTNCGAKMPDNAAFCTECGNKLK